MSILTQSHAWLALRAHRQSMAGASLAQLFVDEQRFEHLSLRLGELLLDYSKNLVDSDTIKLLAALARERGVGDEMLRLFSGEKVNTSENRPALHTALRGGQPVMVDGADVMPQIQATLERMREFSDGVRAGSVSGHGGKPFTDIVNIGIGGSHLGPALATRALAPYASPSLRVHFVSNLDIAALQRTLAPLNAATTLAIIASKTFTTVETLANARSVRDWISQSVGGGAHKHLVAVTANTQLALDFGISQ
ncbi:MAG TPA: glucose-6-phosphate isomerase, partial [Burkholderiales bacterium]|nr:glucose-6-phosphate isomerase [Burkholderiales bacterium]